MKDPARHRRLMDLFDEVCDLPAALRDARIAALHAEDAPLADELARLVAADSDGGQRAEVFELGAAAVLGTPSVPPPRRDAPERIGRYRVVRTLGHGGMGVVYEAEQELPRRRVAVKVVRPEVDTPALRRRFVFEAQALGRLSHPGISRIYEAAIEDDLCFFAMELIEGRPITEGRRSTVAERAELLAKVCDAVHHAHLRGVIHCDLKPANILVGDDGQPKILDFGVARIVDPDSLMTGATLDGFIVGTPAYMSPEQTQVASELLDARTDIYSVGVVAWELFAGKLPHDSKGKAVPEVLRMIRDDEPAPLGRIQPALRGDIETIVGKALAREPAARYQSAQAMADDLRCFLSSRPIAARPPTLVYSLRKFARRNRGLAAALSSFAVLLVVSLVVTALLLVRADNARAALRRSLDEATLAFARAALARDPTISIARLKTLSPGADWNEALVVARAAVARGVAAWVLDGHPASVHSAAFFGEGRVISASVDGTVDVWSLADRTVASVHTDGELRWVEPARGDAWAAGTALGTVYFGKGSGLPEVVRAHEGSVVVGLESPDGQTLATGGGDGDIKLWPTGRRLGGHRGAVQCLAWSAAGTELASGGADGTVRVWDVTSGRGRILGSHDGEVQGVALGGEAIVSVGRDGQAIRWDLATGGHEVLEAAREELKAVAVGPTGAATWGGRDGKVRLYKDGAVTVVGQHAGVVRTVAFAPDGKTFASGGDDRVVRVFWVATGAGAELLGHEAWVRDVRYAPDGERIVSASDDGTVRIWSMPAPAQPGARRLAFSADGKLLAAADADRSILVGPVGAEPRRLTGHTDEVYRLAFTPDGDRLVSAGRDRTVRVWDLATGGKAETLPTPLRAARLAVGPGGRIAAATPKGPVPLWLGDGAAPRLLEGHDARVRDLAFVADGRLVTASEDRTVRVWDASGTASREKTGAAAGLLVLAVAPDGKRVAAAGEDGVVHIWDLDGDGHEAYPAHEGTVTALAWDAGANVLASGGADRAFVVHRAGGSGNTTTRLGSRVSHLAFAGDVLVVATSDGAVRAYGDLGGGPGRVLVLAHGPVVDLAVSAARGLVAVTSDADGLCLVPLDLLAGGAPAVHAFLDEVSHAEVDADGNLRFTPYATER